jgi:nucleoid-associated protein YgaU
MRIVLTVFAAATLLVGCGRPAQSPDAPNTNGDNVVSSDRLEPMDDNAGYVSSADDGVVVVTPPQYPADDEGFTAPPIDDTPPRSTPVMHTAGKGDTFWSLSRKYYGDPKQWRRIQEANPSIKHNAIPIGTKIVIPQD